MVARTTLQEFNVALIELGDKALPLAIAGVKGLSTGLGWIAGDHYTKEDKSFKPNWMEHLHDYLSPGNWFGKGVSALPKSEDVLKPQPQSFTDGPMGPPIELKPQPISLSLNVDGRVLAQSISEQLEQLYEHATGSANYNGMSHFNRADGGISGT
jgi:hypothetical protein